MKLAGGPENFFKTLEQDGIGPFRNIGQSGIKSPGKALAIGLGLAGAGLAATALTAGLVKKHPDRKELKRLIRREVAKAQKAKQPKGLNFDIF